MNLIFDYAFQNLDTEENNFFILVFEQLLNQFDNLLDLIFSLQMNSDITIELEGIQEYGQKILRKQVSNGENKHDTIIVTEYKAQIIMAITIQSVHWYKNNKNKVSREEMISLYKETLGKL